MHKIKMADGDAAFISAIGGAISVPLTPILGWLSDVWGRLKILVTTYVSLALGAMMLYNASKIGSLELSSALISVFLYSAAGLRTAIIGDFSTARQLANTTSFYEACAWFGAMLGFGFAGVGIGKFGSSFFIGLSATGIIASLVLIYVSMTSSHQEGT